MDGRQEKDDIQVGLEDEIEQEGLAPEQGHEKQERCRARHGDGQQGLERQHEQRSAAVGSRGRGVCSHRRGDPGHGYGVHGHSRDVRGHRTEYTGKSWVCPR